MVLKPTGLSGLMSMLGLRNLSPFVCADATSKSSSSSPYEYGESESYANADFSVGGHYGPGWVVNENPREESGLACETKSPSCVDDGSSSGWIQQDPPPKFFFGDAYRDYHFETLAWGEKHSIAPRAWTAVKKAAGVFIVVDRKVKEVYEGFRINTHYPVSIQFEWNMRPQRPSIPRLILRTADWWTRFSFDAQMRALQQNKRMFDTDLRKTLLGKLNNIQLVGQPQGHSHANAASERTSLSIALRESIVASGLTPYVVSAGARDHKDSGGRAVGCRLPYMSKDLLEREIYCDPLPEDSCIVMIDVDYFTDMRWWLKFGRPIALYSFAPTAAASVVNDSSWELRQGKYTDAAGNASYSGTLLHCRVNGGAVYEHPLWDYGHDTVQAVDWFGNCLTYYVEQRSCPSGRRLVVLVPASSVAYPYWTKSPVTSLQRFECMVGSIPVVDIGTGCMSVGCPGTFEALDVSKIDYIGWAEKAKAVGLKHVVDVEKWMAVSENKATKDGRIKWAPIMFALLKRGWTPDGAGLLMPTGAIRFFGITPAQHYVCSHPAGSGDSGTGGEVSVAFAPALVTLPIPTPYKCLANAATAHQVRVKDTQKKFADHAFPQEMRSFAAEYRKLVIGEHGGSVNPLDVAELAERWKRPSQAKTIGELHTLFQPGESRVMRGFMKGEPGYKPRQIVNCDGDHNAPLALFTLAIMEHLKQEFKWVGCGRTPAEIEERVNSVSTGLACPDEIRALFGFTTLEVTHEGDITNCDGSEKRWHRDNITDPIMLGLIIPEMRPLLRSLLRQEAAGFTVKMAEGYQYTALWELISGTSATTLKNILKVSFGDYCALRRCGLTPWQAFACLGVYCGDDSVSIALPIPGLAESRVVALRDLAMDQKLIVRTTPDPVSFLGEFHYGAFFYGGRRMPDFWRQVQKCHLTTNRGVPVAVAAANKAAGALSSSTLSDPLLGPWFTKVALLSGDVNVRAMTREEQFKIGFEETSHTSRLALRTEIVDDWCCQTGIDRELLEEILAQIDRATTLEELPCGVLDNSDIVKQLLPGSADNSGTVVPAAEPSPVRKIHAERKQEGQTGPRDHQSTQAAPRPRSENAQPQAPRTRRNSNSRQPRRGGAHAIRPGGRGRPPA